MTRDEAAAWLSQPGIQAAFHDPHTKDAIQTAIKALTAEAVSREFYEDVVKANHGLAKENSELKEQIESADAVQGWIPCSKRLPENTAEWKAYITCNEEGIISKTFWADGWNCSRNSDGKIIREYEFTDIVAWMPLPEPYREDGEA